MRRVFDEDREWKVQRKGWSTTNISMDDISMPQGHRFGYMVRRNKLDPKKNMVAAMCLCGWKLKTPNGKWDWQLGRKQTAMYQFIQHLKEVDKQGTLIKETTREDRML